MKIRAIILCLNFQSLWQKLTGIEQLLRSQFPEARAEDSLAYHKISNVTMLEEMDEHCRNQFNKSCYVSCFISFVQFFSLKSVLFSNCSPTIWLRLLSKTQVHMEKINWFIPLFAPRLM